MEALKKELHNLVILHKDTMEQCQSILSSCVASDAKSDHSDVSPLRMRRYIQTCKEVYARHALELVGHYDGTTKTTRSAQQRYFQRGDRRIFS